MLQYKEDLDANAVMSRAYELLEFIVNKYNVTGFHEFKCPYMLAIAEELYDEVEDGDDG
jgi:hypothetical protein